MSHHLRQIRHGSSSPAVTLLRVLKCAGNRFRFLFSFVGQLICWLPLSNRTHVTSVTLTVLSTYMRSTSCSLNGIELMCKPVVDLEAQNAAVKAKNPNQIWTWRNSILKMGAVSLQISKGWSNDRLCSGTQCISEPGGAGKVALHWLGCDSREAECEGRRATVTLESFKSLVPRQPQAAPHWTVCHVQLGVWNHRSRSFRSVLRLLLQVSQSFLRYFSHFLYTVKPTCTDM